MNIKFILFSIFILLINILNYSVIGPSNIELIEYYDNFMSFLTIISLVLYVSYILYFINKTIKEGFIVLVPFLVIYIILKIFFLSFNIFILGIGGYENKGTFKLTNNTYYEYYYELYGGMVGGQHLIINKNIRIMPGVVYRKNIYTSSKYRNVKSIITDGDSVKIILVIDDKEPINKIINNQH